jgi:hypothetical protein
VESARLLGLLAGQPDTPLGATDSECSQCFRNRKEITVGEDLHVHILIDEVRMRRGPATDLADEIGSEQDAGRFSEDVRAGSHRLTNGLEAVHSASDLG